MKKNITSGLYAAIDIGTKSVKAIVIEVNNKLGLRMSFLGILHLID